MCFEAGLWDNRLTDPWSVRPVLELLASGQYIKFIHRHVETLSEFELYLDKWLQRQYADYGLGYFALHGKPGVIWIGKTEITIEDLGDRLGRRAEGRVLFFGSCGTVDVPKQRIESLLRATRARAVCGYKADVDGLARIFRSGV